MPQFDATIKHVKDGLNGFTIAAATKNIEGWEATLEKLDAPGVRSSGVTTAAGSGRPQRRSRPYQP